jgi:hypothetical protein
VPLCLALCRSYARACVHEAVNERPALLCVPAGNRPQ